MRVFVCNLPLVSLTHTHTRRKTHLLSLVICTATSNGWSHAVHTDEINTADRIVIICICHLCRFEQTLHWKHMRDVINMLWIFQRTMKLNTLFELFLYLVMRLGHWCPIARLPTQCRWIACHWKQITPGHRVCTVEGADGKLCSPHDLVASRKCPRAPLF